MQPNEVEECVALIEDGFTAITNAVEAEKRLLAFIAEGGEVPGYKAARTKGRNRVWLSESHALNVLVERGFTEESLLDKPRLKSVAELERLIGRANVESLWHFPDRQVVISPEDSPLERVDYE